MLEQLGLHYQLTRTYGIDFYGDVLFTSRNELIFHPERRWAFRSASAQGMELRHEPYSRNHRLIRSRYAPEKSRSPTAI